MDGSRFDQITKRFGERRDRRAVVKGLGGAAISALVAVAGRKEVDAARQLRVTGQLCRQDGDCASGLCSSAGTTRRRYCCVPEVSIQVSALQFTATDTGVFVPAGGSVVISGSGSAEWCTGCATGPDGQGSDCGGNPFPCGSLIASIGGRDAFSNPGAFVFVGTGPTTLTTNVGGELFVQYLDGCSGVCYDGNSGSLTATIVNPACRVA